MTPAKHRLLNAARRQLALDEDTWRAVLRQIGGVESATKLDAGSFDKLVKYLRANGFKAKTARAPLGDRPGMASAAQIDYVRSLWRQLTNGDDERALDRWLERSFKVSALRFLTPDVAQKAITGLRSMVARKVRQ